MNMLNSLILEGVVVSELSNNPQGKEFSIAVSRYYKNADGDMEEEKSYFDVALYGNFAESDIITRNIYLGRGVRIVGRIKQKRWKDEHGKEFSRVVVVAEHIEYAPKICDKKVESGETAGA